MFATAFPGHSAAGQRRRDRAAARLQEHFQPGAAAGGAERRHDHALHDLLDSDDTRVMLDALRALGCGVRHSGRHGGNHRPGRPASGGPCQAVPGQRRHGHAAADGGAGGDRRRVRAERRCPHARAADRRPGRCLAPAGLRHRLPRRAGLSAAAHRPAPAQARRADPGARRRLQPVPHRLADGAAPGGQARHRHRGGRRADLQALHRDHAEPAARVRHRGARATAGSASPFPPAAATSRPATSRWKPTPRRPAISSRWAPSRPTRPARCGSPASARTRSRATSASSTPCG